MGIQNLGDIFSQMREGPSFTLVGTLQQSWHKKVSLRKLFEGRRNNSYNGRDIFKFRENDYNLVENTEFLAGLIFSSSANFGPLMTNDGALES